MTLWDEDSLHHLVQFYDVTESKGSAASGQSHRGPRRGASLIT